jgi:hypothetical protein
MMAATNIMAATTTTESTRVGSDSEEGFRGRSELVVARGGRTWAVEVDTCYGHSSERMVIVPGIQRIDEASETSEAEMDEKEVKAPILSGAQKLRFLALAKLMQMQIPSQEPQHSAVQLTMAELIEKDATDDPALKIPVFSPIKGAPPPVVEIDEQRPLHHRSSHAKGKSEHSLQYNERSDSIKSRVTTTGNAGPAAQPKITAIEKPKYDQKGDDNVDDLLIGFGNRPQKRGVAVRKVVRRNRLLKVFRKSERGNDDENFHIEDDYFGNG